MKYWKGFISKNLVLPLLVLLVLGIGYGLQAGRIGFYLDDWILLEAYKMGGPERLAQLAFMDSRPLVFPFWILGFWVSGTDPFLWQIWSLFWRFMAMVMLWLGWKKLMPDKPIVIGLAVLLSSIYPIFDQQGSALTFSLFWLTLFIWGLSFYFMLLAAESRKYWSVLTSVGLLLFAMQIFAHEYFIGLEILRPLALWWIFRGRIDRIRKTVLNTVPWTITLGFYLVWRLLIQPGLLVVDRNTPFVLTNLFVEPLRTLISLTNMTTRSLIQGILGVWYQTIDPLTFSIGKTADFVSWLIALGLFIAAICIVKRVKTAEENNEPAHWIPMLVFGFIFFLAGIAPGLANGKFLTPTNVSSDRFAMAAMPGAALIITSLVYWLIRSEKAKIGILCLLISLSVGFQFRIATIYRHSWQKQERLFWQLSWRIPEVEKETAFIGNGALAYGMGKWTNASAINLLYGNYQNPLYVDYWYIEAPTLSIEALAKVSEFKKLQLKYIWEKEKSIVFQYDTGLSPCLWVLDQNDFTNPELDMSIRAALPLSDLSRIEFGKSLPLGKTFGKEPDHEWWCYYFQAGELAAQQEDWGTVVEVWEEATTKGYKPYQSSEYISFLQAAGMTEKWDLAEEITKQASILTDSKSQICDMWQGIQDNHPIPDDLKNSLIPQYGCTNLE